METILAAPKKRRAFPPLYTWTGLLAVYLPGEKKCEKDDCNKTCVQGERFCMKCRLKLLKQMAQDGYLQDVPRSVRRHNVCVKPDCSF